MKEQTVTQTLELEASPMKKPSVSIVVPAYNEAMIIQKNLAEICDYMESLGDEYHWEVIVINDGSSDRTGDLADAFAKTRENVHVLHHMFNFRVGQALRYAFNNCRGDYVVTMDIDLSYSPDHIKKLLDKIRESRAKIVIASPYMKGGRVSNVPWLRRTLSIYANRFLSLTAKGNISTITSMVRAYDRKFLSTLNLKAMDMEINAEIIYKAMVLSARVVEIPAHLDWGFQKTTGTKRRSSVRILAGIIAYLLSGFIFRPFMFFILPGLALLVLSLYPIAWAFIHTFSRLQEVSPSIGSFDVRFGYALAAAFKVSPQSFLVGGITLMLGIQLISLGILALQSKRYFEELFHLGTTIYKHNRENNEQR
jgi:glycosyltransferase involved in cell wall biosynthesis